MTSQCYGRMDTQGFQNFPKATTKELSRTTVIFKDFQVPWICKLKIQALLRTFNDEGDPDLNSRWVRCSCTASAAYTTHIQAQLRMQRWHETWIRPECPRTVNLLKDASTDRLLSDTNVTVVSDNNKRQRELHRHVRLPCRLWHVQSNAVVQSLQKWNRHHGDQSPYSHQPNKQDTSNRTDHY